MGQPQTMTVGSTEITGRMSVLPLVIVRAGAAHICPWLGDIGCALQAPLLVLPLVVAVVPIGFPVSRLLNQVLVVVQVAMAGNLDGICPVQLLVVWSAAVPQASVVFALVLASPALVLSLVSQKTVAQHSWLEAALSEVLGPDRRSGPMRNLTEQLLVVASSFSAVGVFGGVGAAVV